MFSNGNLKTPQFSIFHFQFPWAGYGGRQSAVPTGGRGTVAAATGGAAKYVRGVGDAAPYGGNVPILSF